MTESVQLNLHEVASNAAMRLEEFKGRRLVDVTYKKQTYLIDLVFEDEPESDLELVARVAFLEGAAVEMKKRIDDLEQPEGWG